MDQKVKPIWQSKTVWMNLILALSAFIPHMQEMISGNPEIVGAVWAVLNVILRIISKDKVEIV